MNTVVRYISILLVSLTVVWVSGFLPLHAESLSPTIVLGVYGKGIVFSEGGSAVDSAGSVGISGLLGWRKPLSSGGYMAVNSSVDLNSYFIGVQEIDDQEMGSMELSLPAGMNRVTLGVGINSSIFGIGGYSGYFRPDWEVEYRFQRGRRKAQPYVSYQGYLLVQPKDNEDAFFQGGEIGFSYRPSIRHGYKASVGGGWESWFEFPLYDGNGSVTGEKRHDYVINLRGKADGLIGYFVDWRFDTAVALRFSNANRYLEDLSELDENSDSRVNTTLEAGLGWSPTRRINLQIGSYVSQEFYFGREALSDDGSLSVEKLNVFTIGSTFRADWTADDRWYIVVKGSGAHKYANDVAETGWNAIMSGGVEYSF